MNGIRSVKIRKMLKVKGIQDNWDGCHLSRKEKDRRVKAICAEKRGKGRSRNAGKKKEKSMKKNNHVYTFSRRGSGIRIVK